jgi:hypothetical protein
VRRKSKSSRIGILMCPLPTIPSEPGRAADTR